MRTAATSRRRLRDQIAVLLVHGLIAGVMVGLGFTIYLGTLWIPAIIAFTLFSTAIWISYVRNFGTEPIGLVRGGRPRLGRVHVLLMGTAVMGYLVLLAVLAPTMTAPGTDPMPFFLGLVGLWVLLGCFFIVFFLTARRRRRELGATIR